MTKVLVTLQNQNNSCSSKSTELTLKQVVFLYTSEHCWLPLVARGVTNGSVQITVPQ